MNTLKERYEELSPNLSPTYWEMIIDVATQGVNDNASKQLATNVLPQGRYVERAIGSDRKSRKKADALVSVGALGGEDIYLRPASPFVARFVGSINELPNSNGVGKILVRPEDITISEDENELTMSGTVTRVTFQGPVTIISVRVDINDQLVNVHAASGSIHAQVGDRVSLAVSPGRGIVEAA